MYGLTAWSFKAIDHDEDIDEATAGMDFDVGEEQASFNNLWDDNIDIHEDLNQNLYMALWLFFNFLFLYNRLKIKSTTWWWNPKVSNMAYSDRSQEKKNLPRWKLHIFG